MSKSWKLSLVSLATPYKLSTTPLTEKDGLAHYPASPSFILEGDPQIPNNIKTFYKKKHEELLQSKNENIIYDPKLRDYQNQDVNFLLKLPAKGIFNEQRTGKTPTTLVTLRLLNQNKNIIIAPGSTLYQWEKEYKKWHTGPVCIVRSTQPKKARKSIYTTFNGTLITTPGIVRNDIDELINVPFDAIVLDEAHMLRNFKGMQSSQSPAQAKAIIKLSKKIKNRYALTGTPTPNAPWDIYGILSFLFPQLFTSYWKFLYYYFKIEEEIYKTEYDPYTGSVTYKTRQVPVGFLTPQKKQEFLEFLEIISIQRKRKDVMKWIPKVDIEEIALPMTRLQRTVHDHLTQWYEYEHIVCKNELDVMMKQQFLCHSPQLLGFKELGPKTEYILELINDYPEVPIVITSKSRKYLELLHTLIPKKNYLLVGDTPLKTRQDFISQFQKGECNILLGQLDVIKEGIKLDRAEIMIFTDRSYTFTDNLQAEDRIVPTDETKQTAKANQKILRIYMSQSFDEYKHFAIEEKRSAADIVNNYKKYLQEERRKNK